MRTAPDVEGAWGPSFWNSSLWSYVSQSVLRYNAGDGLRRSTYSVNAGSENVQEPLRDEPGETHLLVQSFYTKDPNAVKHRHNSAQAHSDEHEGAERPPGWRAKLWKQHDDGSCHSNARDLLVY